MEQEQAQMENLTQQQAMIEQQYQELNNSYRHIFKDQLTQRNTLTNRNNVPHDMLDSYLNQGLSAMENGIKTSQNNINNSIISIIMP